MLKKIVLFVFMFGIFSGVNVFSNCKFTTKRVDFFGETVQNVNIRTYPCIDSKIIKIAKKGEKYHIVGKTYAYYKIKLNNGQTAWIWVKGIKKINYYILTDKDKSIVLKLINAIEKLIQKKGEKYRTIYQNQLKQIAYRYKNKPRIYTILLKVAEGLTKKENKKQPETTKQTITTKQRETTIRTVNQKTIIFPGKYIDENKIRLTWLNWYNNTRKKFNLVPYTYDARLDKTALAWSLNAAKKGFISHKRHPDDRYYDYKKIEQWFGKRGIVCENVHHYTFTENIGWGLFYCDKNDCTNQLIQAIGKTYAFYISEKNKSYKPHYTSIVAKYFRKIGLGIVVQATNKPNMYKYYLTVHYCTKIK